ncbi:sugar diacid utilization regulator [Pedobacter sp. SG908]|nr:sugar diacid utilization regulator [Pedobacter sp. SG908]
MDVFHERLNGLYIERLCNAYTQYYQKHLRFLVGNKFVAKQKAALHFNKSSATFSKVEFSQGLGFHVAIVISLFNNR